MKHNSIDNSYFLGYTNWNGMGDGSSCENKMNEWEYLEFIGEL